MTQSALQTLMQDLKAYGVTDLVGEDLFVAVADQLTQVAEIEAVHKPAKKLVKDSDVFATPDMPFGQGGAPAVQPKAETSPQTSRPRTEIKAAATSSAEVAAQLAKLKENLKTEKPKAVVSTDVDETLLQKSISVELGTGPVVLIDLPDTNFPKGKTLSSPDQLALLKNIALASGWSFDEATVVFVARQKEDGGFYTSFEEGYLSKYLKEQLATANNGQTYAFGQQSLKLVAESSEISSAQSTEAIVTDTGAIAALPALLSMIKQPHLKKNAWLKILSLQAKSSNISSLQKTN